MLDKFTEAYLECALWASTDPETERPLDRDYTVEDIDPESLSEMILDCRQFQEQNNDDLKEAANLRYDAEAYAGHDFWLTRNGHGAGFWDRGLGKVGQRLTETCKAWGSVDLMPDGNGKLVAY